ncbi:MAG: DUF1549 domain-containing protein [Planctomycetales bacterium]
MRARCVWIVFGLSWLSFATVAVGDDLLPPDRPVEEVVDHYVESRLQHEQVTPALPADDANFIRRATLDLAGRIPTTAEVQAYLNATEPDKKSRLVDRLLASPDFAYHQRNEFDTLLLGGNGSGEWRDWLLAAFQENRPWPQLFRELILAREDDPAKKHAAAFLKARATSVDDLTNDTSKIFFGVSINCAKCHDHPLVADWLQDHYFGMASFFNRTYLTKKNFLAERPEGGLKFRTKAGEEKQAHLMFLTGTVVAEPAVPEKTDEQKKADEAKQQADNDKETPPDPPPFSRRSQLIDVALQPDPNGFFTKAFVNRIWARLMGTGLVTPLDQMHSENPPSHPELLDWLARDTLAHNYDLRRIIRGVVLSRAYGRSSRWEGGTERPVERLFAVAAVRPLTPMQFSLSLSVATWNPLELAERQAKPEEWIARRRDLENHSRGFAPLIEIPGENFQISVSEALLFSNSQRIEQEYLRDSQDRLVATLKGTSDRAQGVQTAFFAVYSRPPLPEEIAAVTEYLGGRDDRAVAGWQQALWSLVTGSEFRFNY